LDVQKYTDIVRRDHYDAHVTTTEEARMLEQLMYAAHGMEITWHVLDAGNPLAGQSVAQAGIRDRTGASVIAVLRQDRLIANPKSHFVLEAGDILGVIGDVDDIAQFERYFAELKSNPAPGPPERPDALRQSPAAHAAES
jgi:CPA2 family monovalent cation:H+ antiporter-2